MINVIATNNKKSFAPKMLKRVYSNCTVNKNANAAFISSHIGLDNFLKITNKKKDHLVYDYDYKTEQGNFLNTTISLPLASLFFIDLPNTSLYRKDDLDIAHIRKMIIPLKYKNNATTIYIDDFENVQCTIMGRDKLWRTNLSNKTVYDDWKERQMEYKMALLYYMSTKFGIDFYIGMTWLGTNKQPKDIRFMKYGYIYDMIDDIEYIDTLN